MAKKRKIVQISMGGEGNAEVHCLCDDGTVWRRYLHRDSPDDIGQWVMVQIIVSPPDAP